MPLNSGSLKGMWAGMPIPWTNRDQLDEEALRENTRRICAAEAHGVYTHGTTGEFYAQSEEEWKNVARATVEECQNMATPSQVGCTALWTGGVIRKAVFAQTLGTDAIQIAFPFWLPLNEIQSLNFLKEVSSAVPEMPITLYNTSRSKMTLTEDLLKKILASYIPLVGCKGVRSKEELDRFSRIAPQVQFFVGEADLASHWKYGARGSYSSFIYACPHFMLRYYQLCEEGSSEAQSIGRSLRQFSQDYVEPRYKKGMHDTAFDRTFAAMTGFLTGNLLQCRGPYESPSQEDVEDCRTWFSNYLPAFLLDV